MTFCVKTLVAPPSLIILSKPRGYSMHFRQTTFDLSVKNPNKSTEPILRSPKDILAEMATTDTETEKILNKIKNIL